MVLWPARRVDGMNTINQERGWRRFEIADRMDLTLECIRRYYDGDEKTPLGPTLARYPEFFGLFGSFEGYIEHFLLQDLVEGGRVKFFLPFEGFGVRVAMPQDVAEYRAFRDESVHFVVQRNARIDRFGADLIP